MSRQDDIKKLIANHQRRLQLLKEQQALRGHATPPDIIIEIEDIGKEIEALQEELENLPRIFISYKRNVEPDERVVLQVCNALNQDYAIFIDQMMPVGTHWPERIKAELRRSDYLITFLSAESIHSEMVEDEIATAHHLAREQQGRPFILPVRLAYREPFHHPLNNYLDGINWAFWQSDADTPYLIEELKQAIAGGNLSIDDKAKAAILQTRPLEAMPVPLASAQPLRLETPEGTMHIESAFYVERESDRLGLKAIERQGETITIKGPRQMGKSSLLNRIKAAASETDKAVAFLDFQLFDQSDFNNSETFMRKFCAWIAYQLKLDNRLDEYWDNPLSNSMRCSNYFSEYLLKSLGRPLVLTMDEVDRLFDTDFRSDFFGMLRSWHNSREIEPVWKQLDLALVTSTEPYQFIDNLNQSPFNVGEIIELDDFTADQVADLNQRHGAPLHPDQERQLITLVGGHPYLVRKALYLVASRRISVTDLFKHAADDRGPFGDHLRHHLFRLHDRLETVEMLRQVIHHNTCSNEHIFFRLRGAGLVRREGQAVVPRCQLYADYFKERLHG